MREGRVCSRLVRLCRSQRRLRYRSTDLIDILTGISFRYLLQALYACSDNLRVNKSQELLQ